MTNIFRRMEDRDDYSVFKEERVLKPEYLPDDILHRETEIRELVSILQPFVHSRSPENVFVFGPPGTGKTVTCRYVLNQLEEYTSKVRGFYINCWEYNTRYSIFSKIGEELGLILPRRGLSADEVLYRIVDGYRHEGLNGMVIVLDEVDRLFVNKDEGNVLYDLARATENIGVNISIIIISNYRDFLINLDPRIRSSLMFKTIEFEPYSITALKDILRERSHIAFRPGVLDDDVIPLCAALGVKFGGDARVALTALWLAGREADREGSKHVTVNHVNRVKDQVFDFVLNTKIVLNPLEKKILSIIDGREWVSGDLYRELKERGIQLTDRSFRNYLKRLHELGLISVEETRHPSGRGMTRVVRRVR